MPPKKQPHIEKHVAVITADAARSLKDHLAHVNIKRRADDMPEMHSYELLSEIVLQATSRKSVPSIDASSSVAD